MSLDRLAQGMVRRRGDAVAGEEEVMDQKQREEGGQLSP